jgi:hypothetical protein
MSEQQHEMKVDIGGGRERTMKVDYPSNSKLSKTKPEKPEKKPIEKIVSGPVELRKRGMASKILQTFLVEDSESIIQYIVMDVLVPAAKNTISDVVNQAIHQAFWGRKGNPISGGRPGYTSYNRVNVQGRVINENPRVLSRQERSNHDLSGFILNSRAEAEDVIEKMRNVIEQYSMVSVDDLYDMLGLTGDFPDAKWGWTDLRNATVRPVQGGYLLDLPGTVPLT